MKLLTLFLLASMLVFNSSATKPSGGGTDTGQSVSPEQTDSDSEDSEQGTCNNFETRTYCWSDTDSGSICGVPWETSTLQCIQITDTTGGDHSSYASFIDNWTFNYIHMSTDIHTDPKNSGCGPCGASSASSSVPKVYLVRSHRFRNTTEQSSFGPGIFSNWDINIKLFKDENGRNRVDLSNPSDLNTRRLFPQNGRFVDTFARSVDGLILYKENNSTTTNVDLAVRAELITREKRVFKFDIFDFEGSKAGRLTEIINRNGYSLTVAYEFLVNNSDVDETEKWKMASVSDETGRTITFTYLAEQRNSMWVIGSAQMPNGSFITYDYNPVQDEDNPESDERLIAVNFPDGTQSTFAREVTPSGKTKVTFFEAGQEGFDRNKSAYLSSNIRSHSSKSGVDFFNDASLLVSYVTKGQTNEEVAYYGKVDGHIMHRQVYEGEGKLKRLDIDLARFFENWSFDEENSFTGSKEASFNHGDWKFYAGNRQGAPPVMTDQNGLKYQMAYNADNAKKRKTYPDDTFEAWSHNEFLQVTRHRDRLGRVTHYTYDERGNKLTKTVGLKAQPVNGNNERIGGLSYKLYAGVFNQLPNFGSLKPYDFGVISTPELDAVNRADKFAALYEGDIEIATGGEYTFWTASDDGSKLYIDGNLVVDNDGTHALTEVESVKVTLSPGHHTFRLEFFEKTGNQQLFVYYQGPDTLDAGSGLEEKVAIPQTVYSHIATGIIEEDVTTSATAVYEWRYYEEGHPHQFLLKEEVDANGNVTEYIYNSDHLLEDIKTPADQGSGQITQTHFEYDAAKRLLSSKDAEDRTTVFNYDSRDRVVKISYNDNSTELAFFGTGRDANLLIKKKDRNGNTTKFEYDEQGRKTTQITAFSVMSVDGTSETENPTSLQSVSTYAYLNGVDKVKAVLRDGELTEYFYDYRHRLVETRIHADNNSVLVNKLFYKNNLLQFREDPYGRRTYFSYRITSNAKSDAAMTRMVQETVPAAVTLTNGYYSEIENLPRIFSDNAPYLVTDYINDDAAQVIATIDPRGIRHETDYDFRGREIFQVNDSEGMAQTTQTIYDANSNVVGIIKPRYFDPEDGALDGEVRTYTKRNLLKSRTVAKIYDSSATSPVEATEYFTYYDDGRKKDHTDFRGNTSTTIWHQCCGRLQANVDQEGNYSVFNNDYFGNVTHTGVVDKSSTIADYHDLSVDAAGERLNTVQEITTRYDSRHRPIARTVWLQSPGKVDPNKVPIATDPAEGLTTRWDYFDELDGHSELSEIIAELNSDGIVIDTDADGSAVITTNPEGEKTVALMDGAGRTVATGALSKTDGSLVTWSTVTHDTLVNNLLEITQKSALDFENKVRADGAGRRLTLIDAEGNVSEFKYDNNSNVVSFRDANGVGEDCIFDDLNRDTSCTDTEGSTVTNDYDLNNNIVIQTDAKGNTKVCEFDDRNRRESCTDRIGGTTTYAYDTNSNVKTITDALLKTTTYEYDERNYQIKVIYPDHVTGANEGSADYGITLCSYDALGRKKLITDQKGEKVEYVYDLASRLTDRIYYLADDTEESRDEFEYDDASRMETASKGRYGNIISFTYDSIGRKKTETTTVDGDDYTVTYQTFDDDSRLKKILYPTSANNTDPLRSKLDLDHTDRNQLKLLTFNASPIITEFKYDEGMREKERNFGNGLKSSKAYNSDNTLDSITVTGHDALSFSYTYDLNNNIESETTGGVVSGYSWNATFDDEDRIDTWTRTGSANVFLPKTQDWTLDKIGNWDDVTTDGLFEDRNHNNAHEITLINPTGLPSSSPSHDVKGNLTGSQGAALTWDIDNHLSSYTQGNVTSSFTYDALGRRLEKLNPAKNTLFISAGHQVLEEYESVGIGSYTLARSYVYGSYVDDVLAKIEISGSAGSSPELHFYHSDHQYNVRGLSDDSSSPQILELYAYSPFGKQVVMEASGSAIGVTAQNNNYGYTGRYLDVETDLWYFRSRYVDSELGRFISRDSKGYVDGMSLYNAYFAEIFLVDPFGTNIPRNDRPPRRPPPRPDPNQNGPNGPGFDDPPKPKHPKPKMKGTDVNIDDPTDGCRLARNGGKYVCINEGCKCGCGEAVIGWDPKQPIDVPMTVDCPCLEK